MARKIDCILSAFFSISLGIFITATAHGQEDSRLAQAFYETKSYEQAREIYGKILENSQVPAWEKNEINYNLGTILMAESRWEEALKKFNEVLQEPDITPLIQKRLLTNIAWTHFLQAMSQAAVAKGDKGTLNDYREGIFLFREALNNIQGAQKASCDLDIEKGEKTCAPDPVLQKIQEAAKIQFTLFLQKFRDFQVAHLTIRDGIPLLLSTLDQSQTRLNFLENKNLTDKVKEHYLQHNIQIEKSQLSYWKIIKEKLEKEKNQPSPNNEEMKIFLEAEKSFGQYIQFLEQTNFPQAQQSLKQTADSLNDLMHRVFGQETLLVVLQKLSSSYTLALIDETLQPSALLGLQSEQKQIESLLDSYKKDNPSLNKNFSLAQKNLSLGVSALSKFKATEARMFVENAQNTILQMIRTFEEPQKNIPAVILERGIEDQEAALSLNRLRQQIEDKGETISSEADNLLKKSQAQVLQTVSSFPQKVIQEEQTKFKSAANPDEGCQDNPWEEVIPLFDQGLQSARQANVLLSGKEQRSRTVMPLQEKTLQFWRDALKLLHQPKKRSQKKKKEEQKKPAAPESAKASLAEPANTELNQTLRLLQEMEQDDRSVPKLDVVPNPKEKKPW